MSSRNISRSILLWLSSRWFQICVFGWVSGLELLLLYFIRIDLFVFVNLGAFICFDRIEHVWSSLVDLANFSIHSWLLSVPLINFASTWLCGSKLCSYLFRISFRSLRLVLSKKRLAMVQNKWRNSPTGTNCLKIKEKTTFQNHLENQQKCETTTSSIQ